VPARFELSIWRCRPGEIDDSPGRRQPIAQVHIDQTIALAIARVHIHLPPADAPKLLERRFQIINLWRPIAHPAVLALRPSVIIEASISRTHSRWLVFLLKAQVKH